MTEASLFQNLFAELGRVRREVRASLADSGQSAMDAPSAGEVYLPAPLPHPDETKDFGHYTTVKASEWPWKNFSPAEVRSKGNGHVKLHVGSMDTLQRAREHWGEPLRLNSAYRDPAYNAKIGGAPLSQHKLGRAFDISVRGMDAAMKSRLVICMHQHGFTGFGGYNTFLHVDTGRARVWGQQWAWPHKVTV